MTSSTPMTIPDGTGATQLHASRDQWSDASAELAANVAWRRDFRRSLVVFVVAIALQFGGPDANVFSLVGLGLWALGGPRRAIQAITLGWLIVFLSPGIASGSQSQDVLRWGILTASAISVSIHYTFRRTHFPRASAALLIFVVYVALTSLFTSDFLDVSLFKLATFALGTFTILLAFEATRESRDYWEAWFMALFTAVVMLGLPLVGSRLGYLRNARGFQGILSHPQAYAVFLGPMVAWIGLRVFVRRHRGRLEVLLFCAGAFSLLLTLSRTAIATVSGAFALVALVALILKPSWRRELVRETLEYKRLFVMTLVLAGLVLASGPLYTAARSFALKGKEQSSVSESFQGSRGGLMTRSLRNFEENPWFGIGFGVPSDPSTFRVRRDPVFDLPISAPVEKGILPVAILEELGLVGAALTIVLVLALVKPTMRAVSSTALALAIAALLVNVGEAVFFSMGGMGIYTWLLIGFARTQK